MTAKLTPTQQVAQAYQNGAPAEADDLVRSLTGLPPRDLVTVPLEAEKAQTCWQKFVERCCSCCKKEPTGLDEALLRKS